MASSLYRCSSSSIAFPWCRQQRQWSHVSVWRNSWRAGSVDQRQCHSHKWRLQSLGESSDTRRNVLGCFKINSSAVGTNRFEWFAAHWDTGTFRTTTSGCWATINRRIRQRRWRCKKPSRRQSVPVMMLNNCEMVKVAVSRTHNAMIMKYTHTIYWNNQQKYVIALSWIELRMSGTKWAFGSDHYAHHHHHRNYLNHCHLSTNNQNHVREEKGRRLRIDDSSKHTYTVM